MLTIWLAVITVECRNTVKVFISQSRDFLEASLLLTALQIRQTTSSLLVSISPICEMEIRIIFTS